jgi:hypothetical protein
MEKQTVPLLFAHSADKEGGGRRNAVVCRDLETETAAWEILGERTKNKQRHLVPLSASVVAILRQIPRSGELVFTTTGATPISGFGKAKTVNYISGLAKAGVAGVYNQALYLEDRQTAWRNGRIFSGESPQPHDLRVVGVSRVTFIWLGLC